MCLHESLLLQVVACARVTYILDCFLFAVYLLSIFCGHSLLSVVQISIHVSLLLRHKYSDVIEVKPNDSINDTEERPLASTDHGTKATDAGEEQKPEMSTESTSTEGGNKNVYILSHLKWGVYSDIERRKVKYWYMPGPLKEYYCYLKAVS